MIRYLKTALSNPKEIYIARNMKGKQFFLYYALLVFLLTISILGSIFPIFQQAREDGEEIAQTIPEFSVEDGNLQTEEESFVCQTTTLLFFFDPDDQMTTDTIDQNMNRHSASIAFGLLDEEMYMNIEGMGQSLSYNQFGGLNQDYIQSILATIGTPSPLTLVIILFILYIGTFIGTAIEMLILALFANIISILTRSGLKFTQTARTVIVASTLPILLLSLTSLAQFNNPFEYEMRIIFSLVLFGISISEMKKRRKQDIEQKKKEDKEDKS